MVTHLGLYVEVGVIWSLSKMPVTSSLFLLHSTYRPCCRQSSYNSDFCIPPLEVEEVFPFTKSVKTVFTGRTHFAVLNVHLHVSHLHIKKLQVIAFVFIFGWAIWVLILSAGFYFIFFFFVGHIFCKTVHMLLFALFTKLFDIVMRQKDF
jgi:hypothetical protein